MIIIHEAEHVLLLLRASSSQTLTFVFCFVCVQMPRGLDKGGGEFSAAAEEGFREEKGRRLGKKLIWRLFKS